MCAERVERGGTEGVDVYVYPTRVICSAKINTHTQPVSDVPSTTTTRSCEINH